MTIRSLRLAQSAVFLPAHVVTAADLDARLRLPAGWVEEKTGISSRHFIEPGRDTNATMGAAAVRGVLEAAGLEFAEVELLINASASIQQPIPCTAALIQQELGETAAASGGALRGSQCHSFELTPSIYGEYVHREGLTETSPLPVRPINEYARTKLAAERLALAATDRLEVVVLRPHALIGFGDNALPDGEQIFSCLTRAGPAPTFWDDHPARSRASRRMIQRRSNTRSESCACSRRRILQRGLCQPQDTLYLLRSPATCPNDAGKVRTNRPDGDRRAAEHIATLGRGTRCGPIAGVAPADRFRGGGSGRGRPCNR